MLAGRLAPLGGLTPDRIAMALVSRYPVGAGIGWHRDRPSYGPVVLGLSLGAPCRLRLRRAREVHDVELPPRSLYVLAGEARSAWEHSIPPVTAERWSVTLRTLSARARARPGSP